MPSDQSSQEISRRKVIKVAGLVSIASLSGCATVMEANGKSETRSVSIRGDIEPPLETIKARHLGGGYYKLTVSKKEGAGRTTVEVSHTEFSFEKHDSEIPDGEESTEINVNSQGPYRVILTSDSHEQTSVRVKIEDGEDEGMVSV